MPTQIAATSVPAPLVPPDLDQIVEETKRLKALRAEYQQLEARMKEIREEVKTTFDHLNTLAPEDFIDETRVAPGSKRQIENPRPIEDKLSIAAGRAIVRAMKQKKTPEECREIGIQAATATANRYGMSKLPDSIIEAIDKKIKTRFNL